MIKPYDARNVVKSQPSTIVSMDIECKVRTLSVYVLVSKHLCRRSSDNCFDL